MLSSAGKDSPRLWRIDGKTARVVRNLPPPLFGGTRLVNGTVTTTNDQSWYDMAIAVDPSDADAIFSAAAPSAARPAGMHRFMAARSPAPLPPTTSRSTSCRPTTGRPSSDITFIGDGVHADVHSIVVSEDGNDVLSRLRRRRLRVDARAESWPRSSARNNGLAVTECGFVASHPGHPGPVAAGTQDNGVIRRIGDTIWERTPWGGDGGGVHFHPQAGREAFLVGQYTNVDWNGNGHFDPPIESAAARTSARKPSARFSIPGRPPLPEHRRDGRGSRSGRSGSG